MAIKVFNVLHTRQDQTPVESFRYAVTDSYNENTTWTKTNTTSGAEFTGQWLTAITNGKSDGGDGFSYDFSRFIVDTSVTDWVQLSGMAYYPLSGLQVGDRFYFAPNAYVSINNISDRTVNGRTYTTIVWGYVKNNNQLGTLSIEAILKQLDTTTQYTVAENAIPLIPYTAPMYSNGTIRYNFELYPQRVYFNMRTWGGTYIQITTSGYMFQSPGSWLDTFFDDFEPIDTDNPYEGAGTSDTGGGDPSSQNFDGDSDDVEEDAMPTLSAVGTGFATLFTPSKAQLKNLADIMWGAQWWQALQNEVMGIDKMFVSLGIMPFVVTQGSTVEVTWLGMSLTEVYLTLAAQQYFEFDMGSIDLSNDSRIWTSDTAMDYSPFCRLGIYLPFIGFQDIDIDECRGKVLNLKYRIDALSGSCVALIKVGNSTLYQFTGNCMVQIPITSQSFDEFISTVTNVAIAGTNVKTAQALAGGGDNVAAEAYTREKNPISEVQGRYQVMQHAAMVSHAENGLASATANAISGLKPSYNKSGAVSASNSLMAVKQPYLFLSSPNVCVPEHYQRYGGFPANITDTLGNFEGFTVVNSIRLNGLVATAPEVEEIYELLHSGVII